MNILDQWIRTLGYQNEKLNNSHYFFKDDKAFLIATKSLKLGFDFPRKINNPSYVEGMLHVKAHKIIQNIFNNQYLEPIEVCLEYDCLNGYHYKLKDGYHRYTISRYLNFSYIPVKIVPNISKLYFTQNESIV